MKKLIGILLIITGVVLGLYLGLWQMFIGGILCIAKSIDNGSITATLVAWNVIKIILATPIGMSVFSIVSGTGLLLIED